MQDAPEVPATALASTARAWSGAWSHRQLQGGSTQRKASRRKGHRAETQIVYTGRALLVEKK